MKEKPILKLYKYEYSQFKQISQIDDYQEISFEHNLYSAGQFTITINYNIPNALLFERGMFIQFGSDPYDFGEILSIRDVIGQDGKGSQIRTITGYDARYIFKRRIIKNLNANGMWKMTAKGEICLRNLIADQCGANAEEKRRLPVTNTIPLNENALGKEYSVSEQFTNLYEVCKTIATQSEIGWRVKFDNGSLKLECYEGTDRSDTVQFSTDFDSLRNGEFSDSSESYSNAIYIGGKGQNDERDIYEGEDGTPNGLDRFEAWDDQSQMTTTDEYTAEALSMLSQYGQTVNVSGNGLAKCPYIYKEQYNVGDIITISFSGKKAVVQILSVTERWAWNQYDINFSFGKPQNNLAEQLQLMLRKIQGASNKEKATESVKWYTIPTATSMPADDVTFNTIGFTGTLTANSTFTLYRDSEGTGAKSYNVYCKNLSGNYTLTLTTGVSGATNFTIKGGSNIVARILVDENGNIVSQGMTATSVIESGNNQPATSDGVNGAISAEEYARNMAIANAIKPVMRPKDDFGVVSTLAQFEANLVSGTKATACCGSQYITDGPGNGEWYNFIYIPHRNGIDKDSYLYGVLILCLMSVESNDVWIIHHLNGDWKSPLKIKDDVSYEDITSECSAINDSITINKVYAYKQGNQVSLTFDVTTKGASYAIVRIPQRYTERSADFNHQWWRYFVDNQTVIATTNQASEFYVMYNSTVQAGVSFIQTFDYFI